MEIPRRFFIEYLLTLFATACTRGVEDPHTPIPVPLPPDGGNKNLTPLDVVAKYALQPTEFRDDVPPEERITSSIDYLKRLEKATREATYVSLSSLGSLQIIGDPQSDARAYPFAYPTNGTIADILRDSLDRINRSDDTRPSMQLVKNNDPNGSLFGTDAVYNKINGVWIPRFTIYYNPTGIVANRDRNEIARRNASLTDAEIALIILHEIGHTWQIQYFVDQLNQDQNQSFSTSEQVSSWIYTQTDAAIQTVRQQYNERTNSTWYNNINPNEAQDNALMLEGLHSLYGLYGSIMPDGVGAIHRGLHPTSPWGFYQAYVLNGPDGALDQKWVQYSGRQE